MDAGLNRSHLAVELKKAGRTITVLRRRPAYIEDLNILVRLKFAREGCLAAFGRFCHVPSSGKVYVSGPKEPRRRRPIISHFRLSSTTYPRILAVQRSSQGFGSRG